MKKLLAILIAITLLSSCSSEQAIGNEKTALLTAVAWKTGPTSNYSVDKFNADGTYTVTFKGPLMMEVRGTWEWISQNEISMQDTEIRIDGRVDKFGEKKKSTDKTIIKITSLSSDKLIGLTHHVLDAEDSGFAKEITYTAE